MIIFVLSFSLALIFFLFKLIIYYYFTILLHMTQVLVKRKMLSVRINEEIDLKIIITGCPQDS